jgi:hypothetical protein
VFFSCSIRVSSGYSPESDLDADTGGTSASAKTYAACSAGWTERKTLLSSPSIPWRQSPGMKLSPDSIPVNETNGVLFLDHGGT